ncbi:aldo/keto reductase [Pseudomonadota bacterium]|jgi:aryl-alcohol dehydrogenase-like predicted oxidoreductase|nr:aldo/keto reductase [Xanthomonadales bacterium]
MKSFYSDPKYFQSVMLLLAGQRERWKKVQMNKRPLGTTGLEVSEIGFGAWQLCNSESWGGMDDRTAHRLVHEAIDGGINLFDTAPNYADTKSECILGEALESKRNRVVLVSKFGHTPEGPKVFSVNWFWQSLEASLRRLRTDYLDVLLLHNPPMEMYTGTDPLWDAMEKARVQGKIRHYGASLDFATEVEECLANTRSEVLEILFNVFHQDVRHSFAAIRAHGAGTIVKVPLDSGWLTGRFDASSRFEGIRARWSAEEIARRAELVSRIEWLVSDGSELAHKAIGYLLSYDEVSCVIPGVRTSEQLESNLAATNHRVSPTERRKLEAFWDVFTENGSKLLPW